MRSMQCPYCGHNTRSSRPPAGDATSLLARARRLEEIIDSLAKERSSLLQRVNDLRPATKDLPNEVLSAIFRQMCQPTQDDDANTKFQPIQDRFDDTDAAKFIDSNHTYPVLPRTHIPPWKIIGSVCSDWRAVAWSTPQLWVTFSAEVTTRNVASVASLLRLHLKNSRNCLVSIELDMTKIEKGPPGFLGESFAQTYMGVLEKHRPLQDLLFMEYPEHIRSLSLTYPPEDWFFGDMKHTNLDTLVLKWPDRYSDLFSHTFTHLPRLRHVFLTNWQLCVDRWQSIPSMELCWDSITVLDFNNIEFEVCVDMLVRCRNLRSFKMLNQSSALASEFGEIGIKIPSEMLFRYLEQLTWSFTDHRYHISIFQALQLPCIRSITFHGRYKRVLENDVLPTFFADLTSSFQSLSVYEDRGTTRTLEHILPHVPKSLIHLRVERCCGSVGLIFPFLFPNTTPQEATRHSREHYSSTRRTNEFPFPELTYLECRDVGSCRRINHEDPLPYNAVAFCMDSYHWEWDFLLEFIKLKERLGLAKVFHFTIPYEGNAGFYDTGTIPWGFTEKTNNLNNHNGFDIYGKFNEAKVVVS